MTDEDEAAAETAVAQIGKSPAQIRRAIDCVPAGQPFSTVSSSRLAGTA
ncbi:MAG: hypothetical protein M3Z57_09070 [Candidatus Dormibacteraeota bacterium]|nr:hypothetical protein [Candidatus Dormibacteraeota bacterium]